VEDIGKCFMILNVYVPSQECIQFWENLLNKSFRKEENLIQGGDINFSFKVIESWGQRAQADAQMDYFSHKLGESGLLDIAPTNIFPTWINKRMRDDYIEKRLDSFLILGNSMDSPLIFIQWVGI
jgi:hypothetical protein